jgi:hypothetical protein
MADEEIKNIFEFPYRKNSMPSLDQPSSRADFNKQLNTNKNQGPNINLKLPRRTYGSSKEKQYYNDKIKTKQKSEVKIINLIYFKISYVKIGPFIRIVILRILALLPMEKRS